MKAIALFMAAYLFLGSLFPQTDFSQLSRLDDLAKHFRLHRAQTDPSGNIEMTWVDFIWIHFIQPDGHHHHGASEQAHHQLPLKSINSGQVLVCHAAHAAPVSTKLSVEREKRFHYSFPSSGRFPHTVFHPPLSLA